MALKRYHLAGGVDSCVGTPGGAHLNFFAKYSRGESFQVSQNGGFVGLALHSMKLWAVVGHFQNVNHKVGKLVVFPLLDLHLASQETEQSDEKACHGSAKGGKVTLPSTDVGLHLSDVGCTGLDGRFTTLNDTALGNGIEDLGLGGGLGVLLPGSGVGVEHEGLTESLVWTLAGLGGPEIFALRGNFVI